LVVFFGYVGGLFEKLVSGHNGKASILLAMGNVEF
jgi:hypothetical protein